MIKTYRTEEVFRTEGYPEHTFIPPPDFQNILVDMRSPHKPIVFEGASGTGKTSAIRAAIARSDFAIEHVDFLSSRSQIELKVIEVIAKTGKLRNKITIIDDFHRLETSIQIELSNMLRLMADNPEGINGKLIIAGINQVGQRLIAVSDDLLKRMAVYRIKPAEKGIALKILNHGAELLNVNIENLEQIYEESKGDYWTLQKLCQQTMLEAEIISTNSKLVVVNTSVSILRTKILEQLSVQFTPLMQDFIRGVRFRKTNRAYFHLIKTFAKCNTASISLNELSILYPSEKARIDQIKLKRLGELIRSKKDVSKKFYYDPETTIFSVEDPALAYFIHYTNWDTFALSAGFTSLGNGYDYEFGISFSGEQRVLAKSIADAFKSDDISVFYDEYEDLLGKDLEKALEEVYGKKSQYVVVIISNEYRDKIWPSFERGVWTLRVKQDAVLPVFVDDIIIKEVSTSRCRIDFRQWRDLENSTITQLDYEKHFKILLERIKNVLEAR